MPHENQDPLQAGQGQVEQIAAEFHARLIGALNDELEGLDRALAKKALTHHAEAAPAGEVTSQIREAFLALRAPAWAPVTTFAVEERLATASCTVRWPQPLVSLAP